LKVKSSFNDDISLWNTSSVTNMSYMFYDTNINQNINTKTVTSHPYLAITYTAWDVSGVQNMSYMFNSGKNFQPTFK